MDVMKKKQMLAMLVMLSLLQTTAYADYLKPALTQGDKFDGLVWWHDGELYAKNEDGVVQKLEIVTDTDGHRVATANIKGDVTGTALDYSFGWQSSLTHPTDELILSFDGNVDVGYTNQNNLDGVRGGGFTVGTDTFDMTIKMQNDKTLYVGTPASDHNAAFQLFDYVNEGKENPVNLKILGGNIVTHFERNYDSDTVSVFGAVMNLNGYIKPGTITVNNESITSTLADNFSSKYTVSGAELSYGNLNITTNNFTLGSTKKRFDKGAWLGSESTVIYNIGKELEWYVEEQGALVVSGSRITFSGAGNALFNVADGKNTAGIWISDKSEADTGNGINSLIIDGGVYGLIAKTGSSFDMKGNRLNLKNNDYGVYLNDSNATYKFNEIELANKKYGFYLNKSNVTTSSNNLTITNDSGWAVCLFNGSTADLSANITTIEEDIYSKASAFKLKSNNSTVNGQVRILDGGTANFSSFNDDSAGVTTIKHTTSDAVTATSDEDEISKILFKQATFINSQGDEEYHADKQGVRTNSAIRANRNSEITLENTAGIYGDIIAGRGNDNENAVGGKVSINSIEGADFKGDVLAGNGGEINFTLNNANYEGRVDDYADATLKDIVFRREEFDVDVTKGGTVNMTLNKSNWDARGQSFVTELTFENGGSVNLVDDNETDGSGVHGNSVTIRNLKGDGTFNMTLNSADHSLGDMLYIGKNEGKQTINIVGGITGGLENISEDNPLRFATVGIDSISDVPEVNNSGIKAYTRDAGFADIEYYVDKEVFDKNDNENEKYNGSGNGETVDKPGNNFVENELVGERKDAVNWIITGAKELGEGGSQVSDAGKTIINMSRANYNNAIYMDRLNKRMGEARYINGEEDEGMWVRLRHDRIGKDEQFRSQNTMYEVGYDQKQECDNGERRIGMAIDYMDGKTSYTGIAGDGDIKRYGLWLYDTWLGNKGHYVDYVAKWGHLENDFDIMAKSTGEKITGDYSNNVFSISAEYGRKKEMGNDWYFEPQAQVQLARVTGADYETSQGTKVSVDGINSLIGRAGFRLGKDFGTKKQNTVYLKADVLHEFLGEQDMYVRDNTFNGSQTFENEGTWYDVGFGFAAKMSKNSYAFMDFEKSFGNDNEETYQINVGMQWSF